MATGRKRSLLLLVGALSVGCASPKKETVWVDLDRVLALQTPVVGPRGVAAPKPPAPAPPRTAVVPGLPPQVLPDRSSPGPIDQRTVIANAQERALRTLRRRLAAVYNREADRFAREQRRKLGSPERRALREVLPDFEAAFRDYADERMRPSIRLAFVAGFPDPNPENRPVPTTLSPLQRQRAEEASRLRAQLNALDQRFDARAEAILSRVGDLARTERSEFLRTIDAYRDEMNARAFREASGVSAAGRKEISLELASARPIPLPAVPESRVEIPGGPPIAGAPQVDSGANPQDVRARRERAERQLRIWSGVTRRTLASRPNGGRDATEEFLTWRREHLAGL